MGREKLGQPQPESNLSVERNRVPRRNVHINAGLVVIEIFVAEGRFRRIVPRNCKLLGRQAAAQLVIRFFPVDGSGFPGLGRLLELAGRNMAVAAGVVVQIALVVFFRP